MAGLYRRDEDEHGSLSLWVNGVGIALYGRTVADEHVLVERRRRGPYLRARDARLTTFTNRLLEAAISHPAAA